MGRFVQQGGFELRRRELPQKAAAQIDPRPDQTSSEGKGNVGWEHAYEERSTTGAALHLQRLCGKEPSLP